MTATSTPPTRPLPTVTVRSPGPPHCGWCDGTGVMHDEDFGEVACLGCGGSGEGDYREPVEFVLDRTRTHKHRSCRFAPHSRRLAITQGRKTQAYTVREFPVDQEYGRGFAVEKDDGEVYEFRCGPAGVDCSCDGETYQSSAKANQRAVDEGREVYATWGCAHADALVPLIAVGWLDQ